MVIRVAGESGDQTTAPVAATVPHARNASRLQVVGGNLLKLVMGDCRVWAPPQTLGSFFLKLKHRHQHGGCEKECERAQPVVGEACVSAA